MKFIASSTGLLQYKDRNRVLCAVDPITLTPTWRKATPQEKEDIEWHLQSLIPGEVLSNGIVLGPALDFKYEVHLHAVGNPDFKQYADIGPKKVVRVVDLDTASKVVMDYQELYDMGGGNCSREHGNVYSLLTKTLVGRVTYNGSIQLD